MAEGGRLTARDLGLTEAASAPLEPLAKAKERFARSYVAQVLSLNDGNRTKTAQDLAVDPRTIYRYLEAERVEQGE